MNRYQSRAFYISIHQFVELFIAFSALWDGELFGQCLDLFLYSNPHVSKSFSKSIDEYKVKYRRSSYDIHYTRHILQLFFYTSQVQIGINTDDKQTYGQTDTDTP